MPGGDPVRKTERPFEMLFHGDAATIREVVNLAGNAAHQNSLESGYAITNGWTSLSHREERQFDLPQVLKLRAVRTA